MQIVDIICIIVIIEFAIVIQWRTVSTRLSPQKEIP